MYILPPLKEISNETFAYWNSGFTNDELDKILSFGNKFNSAEVGSKGNINKDIRISEIQWLDYNDDTKWLYDKFSHIITNLNAQFFRFDLTGLEDPFQFTVYNGYENGNYKSHIDSGNNNSPRKLSLVLQLSDPSEYEGGDLQLFTSEIPMTVNKQKGLVTAFPSYTLHKVTPVTSGVRKTLVCWVSGPAFR